MKHKTKNLSKPRHHKKDWVNTIFGRKVSKRERVIVKGTIYGVGTIALLGAGASVVKGFGK